MTHCRKRNDATAVLRKSCQWAFLLSDEKWTAAFPATLCAERQHLPRDDPCSADGIRPHLDATGNPHRMPHQTRRCLLLVNDHYLPFYVPV
jgi:hypothetical protein